MGSTGRQPDAAPSRPNRVNRMLMLVWTILMAPPIAPDWVRIRGGTFEPAQRGAHSPSQRSKVTLKTFEITRTEVTVAQYAMCVKAGACPPVLARQDCTGGDFRCVYYCKTPETRPNHPRNCVLFEEATAYARWVGGDLPTWWQWAFAGRDRGRVLRDRWGDERPTCGTVIFNPSRGPGDARQDGCGRQSSWPVCSRPKGNSAQGLCDMRGNLEELVRDPHPTVPSRWHMTSGGSYADQIGGLSLSLNGPGSVDGLFRTETAGFRVVRRPGASR
jgi:formylglycine-generating enzyme required for sulfatase activity